MPDFETAFWVTMFPFAFGLLIVILANFGWIGVFFFTAIFDGATRRYI